MLASLGVVLQLHGFTYSFQINYKFVRSSTVITYLIIYHFVDTAVLDEDYSILESTISFNMTSALSTDIEECVEAFMVLADDNLFEADNSITVMIINATAARGSEMYNLNVSSSALNYTIVDQPGKYCMNPTNVISNIIGNV